MVGPMGMFSAMQQATILGMVTFTRGAASGYAKLLEGQAALLHHPVLHGRRDDGPGAPPGPELRGPEGLGADLHDHYGRRAHDVDVEHL